MKYDIRDIANITGGVLLQQAQAQTATEIKHLLIDSRKIIYPESSVFFAITGDRNNGHAYLADAYAAGVKSFVVEKEGFSFAADANVILVPNAIGALQKIAAFHRGNFKCPVVGITGSNGKTIVKEWLYHLLKEDVQITRSPKSFNSQVGVPLSVWAMTDECELGVFEAGISKVNEMQLLQQIIQPNIGIFTYLGAAHDEGFKDEEEKLAEKLKLFSEAQILVYCADQPNVTKGITQLLFNTNPTLEVVSWSRYQTNATHQFHVEVKYQYTTITTRKGSQTLSINVPFVDEASIHNACSCFAFLLTINRVSTDVLKRFEELQPVEMRMQLKEGLNGCVIINDSYNADVNALQIALDFLEQQSAGYNKTLILSDLLQSGLSEASLYQKIASLVAQRKVNKFIGVGQAIAKYKPLFEPNSLFYNDTEAFLSAFKSLDFKDEVILIKGARQFQFEKISLLLEKRVHETVFEINLNAMVHNLNVFKSKLNPGVKLMAMVKAFSYGAGSYEIAKMMEFNRVDYLAVAYADEGVALRKNGIKLPIMVMNPEASGYDAILQHNLEPEVYSLPMLNKLIEVCNGQELSIHIELDTGMKRLGFDEVELDGLITLLQQHQNLRIKSVFTHLVASEDKRHDLFTHEQLLRFESMSKRIIQSFSYPILRHALNSAGIIRFADGQFDMVRLGIGLYGIDPSEKMQKQLQQIGTLKTVISQIKEIQSHETVGYSRKGVVQRNSKIAIIAIGYADGLNRKLGNGKGHVLINGVKAPIVGSICMDMTMVDVTNLHCQEGDEVVVIGKDNSVIDLANKVGTIPYEILTGISQRVKRVYFFE